METKQYDPFLVLLAKMWLSTISKCAAFSWTCNNGLPLHCCQSTKYSVLLLATECIKRYECERLYACVSVRLLA